MPTLYLTIIVGIAICGLFIAGTLYLKMMDELREVIEGHFSKDLEKTKQSLKFVDIKRADEIIDEFEKRWKGRVDKGYLNYSIGRLVEEQFKNESIYKQ